MHKISVYRDWSRRLFPWNSTSRRILVNFCYTTRRKLVVSVRIHTLSGHCHVVKSGHRMYSVVFCANAICWESRQSVVVWGYLAAQDGSLVNCSCSARVVILSEWSTPGSSDHFLTSTNWASTSSEFWRIEAKKAHLEVPVKSFSLRGLRGSISTTCYHLFLYCDDLFLIVWDWSVS